MSKYTVYYKTKQNAYRELATKWSRWSATTDLTSEELDGIAKFFYPIAKRFGLIKEFKDINIL